MLSLLIRIFIKDNKDTKNPAVREKYEHRLLSHQLYPVRGEAVLHRLRMQRLYG